MIDIPIVDSHIHFWDSSKLEYPWLKSHREIASNHLPKDFFCETKGIPITELIFVQAEATDALQEVQFVSLLAEEEPRVKAIIAQAPLELGKEVESYLQKVSSYPLVKGVRRLLQTESKEFIDCSKLVEATRLLSKYKLTSDLCFTAGQLEGVVKLVKQCPEVSFIIDHLGKPDIVAKEFKNWQFCMKQLARMDNVYCKISGGIVEQNPQNWEEKDIIPYLKEAIELFGDKRIIYGGNWPVIKLGKRNYQEWFNLLKKIVKENKDVFLKRLYNENAKDFYDI